MSEPVVAAVVPAAGASLRMGRPKLLIEFEGAPLIARVVATLIEAGAVPVVVVSPPIDVPEGPPLIEAAMRAGAIVSTPDQRPPAMRDSVELAVAELERSPSPPAAVLLVPADGPRLDAGVVARLVQTWRERPDRIVIPTHQGRRGHPVVLPWRFAQAIAGLPPGVGVNALMAERASSVVELAVDSESVLVDLDTPEDLLRVQSGGGRGRSSVVRLFAGARERAGRSEVRVALPEPATVGDLRRALATQHPRLADVLAHSRIAVDDEYADDPTPIPPNARLALIPPVSGG